jgi:2-dehydro-3-deoxygluconokinase
MILVARLQKLCANVVWIHRTLFMASERLGVYFLENGAMQRASRIVYDRFDSAFAHIKPEMIALE